MKDNDKVVQHDRILAEMHELYKKKNKDYGDSFDKAMDKRGLVSALIRMEDKMNRLDELVDNDAEVDESIEDSLIDLANYAVMTVRYLRDNKEATKLWADNKIVMEIPNDQPSPFRGVTEEDLDRLQYYPSGVSLLQQMKDGRDDIEKLNPGHGSSIPGKRRPEERLDSEKK